jgi:tetratricopeptide (TPR) repeat protein
MTRQDALLLGTLIAAALGLLGYGLYSERVTADAAASSPAASVVATPSALASASATPGAPHTSLTSTQLLDEICGPAGEPSCECRKRATLAAFDRRAPTAGLDIVRASAEACRSGALLGLEAEALARSSLGEPALEEARRVLAVDPKNPYATYASGLTYQKAGKPREAINAARDAVKLGRGATAHVLVGLLEYQNKNFDEAEAAFETALEVDPKSAEAMFNLAVLHQRRNDYHKTRESYLKTLRIDPTHSDALYNLAILTRGIGATSEAKHYVEKLSRLVGEADPRVVRLRETLGPPDERKSALELRVDRKKALSSPKQD